MDPATFVPRHFRWALDGRVGTITLDRPERKNPLTFESCAELRDLRRELAYADGVKAVLLHGAAAISAQGATCTRLSAAP